VKLQGPIVKPWFLVVAGVALSSGDLRAQDHANVARGQGRYGDLSFGLDTVNPMNGNLGLTIPLPAYPVGPRLTFQLFLRYNSEIWEYQDDGLGGTMPIPARTDNSGLGWRLSVGQLVPPSGSGEVDSNRFVYVDPAGANMLSTTRSMPAKRRLPASSTPATARTSA
jgi:hypothetical protein